MSIYCRQLFPVIAFFDLINLESQAVHRLFRAFHQVIDGQGWNLVWAFLKIWFRDSDNILFRDFLVW